MMSSRLLILWSCGAALVALLAILGTAYGSTPVPFGDVVRLLLGQVWPPLAQDIPGTIARIVQGGRSTFYCPTCQR